MAVDVADAEVVARPRANSRVWGPRDNIVNEFTEEEVDTWPRNHVMLFLDNLPDDVHTNYATPGCAFQTRLAAAQNEAVDLRAGPQTIVDMTLQEPGTGTWDFIFSNERGGVLMDTIFGVISAEKTKATGEKTRADDAEKRLGDIDRVMPGPRLLGGINPEEEAKWLTKRVWKAALSVSESWK